MKMKKFEEIALVRYAKELGFKVGAIDSEWDRLSRTPLPCLPPHKVAEGQVPIQVPRVARRKQLSCADFKARWGGRQVRVTTRGQLAPKAGGTLE